MIRIHHIGYVVRDIEIFQSSFPGLALENVVEDPLQNARLALYTVGDGSRIELIQPHDSRAFTWAHLERVGEGMHHICYEGISVAEIGTVLQQRRLMQVRGPMKAVLFGRDVVFAISRQRAIVEFLL